MRRVFVVPFLIALFVLGTAAPGVAFIHVTIPGDDCAPTAADTNGAPGNNETAEAAVTAAGVSKPLGGTKSAPTTCPAP